MNALIATVSTPLAAPVICATRLRKGSTNSARGAHRLVADAIRAAKTAGTSGMIVVRADSALCRYRHNADYAEVLVMPMSNPDPLCWAVIGPLRSA